MGRNVVETIIGAVVLLVAGIFTVYAFTHSGSSSRTVGYDLIAKFDRVDGVKRGSDVTIAGVKVGTVNSIELDQASYVAVTRITVDNAVKLPADSFIKIVSESLLGGAVVLIEPGSEKDMMKPGGEFVKTQGARSLVEILASALAGNPK